MISAVAVLAGLALMVGLMAIGMHVATAMITVGILGAVLYLDASIINAFGPTMWTVLNDSVIVAIPLFILLGEILIRIGITQTMYVALSHWLGGIPGGLLHSNIAASGLFAAVSGSSVATAATIGTVALPAFRERQYDPRLVLGTIAAGGTLGILIPPSINMIVYGAMTDTSVGKLYQAGIVPGVILLLMFMATTAILCHFRKAFAGETSAAIPLRARLHASAALVPPLILFVLVMGSIYSGFATPTEAAALGVAFALGLAALHNRLTIAVLHGAFLATVSITGMITLILVAAFFINFVSNILGVPQSMANFVARLGLNPLELIFVLFVFYLILGCFMESLSMMIATLPVVFPLVLAAGIDPVWFGIFLVVMMEIALITPPVGMNLYVVQSVRGEGQIADVIVGTAPFLLAMFLLLLILTFFPGIALWLAT